jgi:COMPASS component SWD1
VTFIPSASFGSELHFAAQGCSWSVKLYQAYDFTYIRPYNGTMNLALVDPFVLAQDYPESTTGSLRSGHATCVRFNRKGDLLAAGRVDGTVVIFDVETNGVARKLKGHTRQVQSLSWSRDGRYLLTSSQDWKCNLWDLRDGSILRSVKFEAPVYIAELHPWNQ